MEKFGIDISVWQRGIDFNKIKSENVDFIILRGMYGNALDTQFDNFYNNAKSLGFNVGVYQYAKAKNVAQAREEAQLLIDNCLKNRTFEYPIFYDIEDVNLINLTRQELTDIINAWCKTLENQGYFVGIYLSQYNFNNEVNSGELRQKYVQWRAYWTTKDKKPICELWQYGGETNLIRSNVIARMVVDQDYSYVDFPTIIKNANKNGFNTNKPTNKKSVLELALEVINGNWGNGIDRKNGLTNAGYNYNDVQSKVNEILKSNSVDIEYYIVKSDDNLTKIAKMYNTNINQLVSWNNIKNANLIYIGQRLRVK